MSIGQRGANELDDIDLDLLQKALELRGYIVFRNTTEYLKSVKTLERGVNDKQLG